MSDSDVAELRSKYQELQQSIDQQKAQNQQLSSQLNERGQALMQAMSQLAALKGLQDGQDTAKAAELSSARKALEAANLALGRRPKGIGRQGVRPQ